ncbi:MAG TPA: SDR family NAD(P)-dependent oxidoreductase [Caulobacteraceae bacterium]|nr:SDR family NAD(P)-dependent oxidoreductase [Caulobacteraceae bacterium]
MSKPLEGRHALVTGGGSGIGAACARRLAGLGARVTLVGRDRAKLDAVAADLPEAFAAVADVTDEAAVTRAFSAAAERFGPVTILIANAGAASSAPFLKTSRADWDSTLGVNLTGAFLCARAALPAMLDAGWGRIVAVASTAGLKGYPYVAAYVAAKHGLVGLTRALALEVAAKGVTVNAVCPGFTDTDLVSRSAETIAAKTGRDVQAAKAALASANPQGRLIAPDEVAATVAWLCLPEAAAVNGAALPVSGGEV